MLSPQSFFKCIPAIVEEAQVRFFVGLAYAYDITMLHYGRLVTQLESLPSIETDDHQLARRRIDAFADAWAVVDNLNRSRQLVSSFPEVMVQQWAKDFVQRLDPIRQLRNRLHHMDEDFTSGANLNKGLPVYGTLTWHQRRGADEIDSLTLTAGPSALRSGGTASSWRVGHSFPSPIGNIKLEAFDQ